MRRTLAFGLACTLVTGLAWGYWSIGSLPGGNGQAQAATVGQGNTPTTTVAGSTITVTWTASTLTNGQAVDGYKVKRYSEATARLADHPVGLHRHGDCALVRREQRAGGRLGLHGDAGLRHELAGRGEPGQRPGHLGRHGAGQRHLAVRGQRWGRQDREHGLLPRHGGGLVAAQQRRGRPRLGPGLEHDRSPGRDLHRLDPHAVDRLRHRREARSSPTSSAGRPAPPAPPPRSSPAATSPATPRRPRCRSSTTPRIPTGSITYPNGDQAGASVSLTLTATDGGSGLASRQIQRASAPLTGTTCGTFTSFTNLGR